MIKLEFSSYMCNIACMLQVFNKLFKILKKTTVTGHIETSLGHKSLKIYYQTAKHPFGTLHAKWGVSILLIMAIFLGQFDILIRLLLV